MDCMFDDSFVDILVLVIRAFSFEVGFRLRFETFDFLSYVQLHLESSLPSNSTIPKILLLLDDESTINYCIVRAKTESGVN